MAHLTFIAKNRDLASYLLTGPAVLGRSVECDVFTPDVFVSRQHCRFEKADDGWVVIDQRSRNGIFYNGKRVYRRTLKHGDLVEIGSFSVRFDSGEIPPNLSTMTPFGEGTAVAALMDTLYTGGMRPAEYLRKSKKKPAWVKAREEAEAAAKRLQEEAEAAARAALEKINFSDGTELDLEAQITETAEAIVPEFVLVSRELLARFGNLIDDNTGTMAPSRLASAANTGASMDASDESIAASDVMKKLSETHSGKALTAAGVESPASKILGPGGPSGAAKNLWDEVYAEVDNPKAGKGKKKEKKSKEDLKAAKEAKKAAKARPDIDEYKPPMGERIRDWYEWAKTVDVSVNGIIGAVSSNPKPFAIAAGIIVLLGGLYGVKVAVTPKYRLSPNAQRELETMAADAARN